MKTTKFSKWSKIIDVFAIILVATLILVAAEFTIRLIGFGNDMSLLLNKEINNQKYLMVNPCFCSKYFPNYTAYVPAIVSQLFVQQKLNVERGHLFTLNHIL